MLIRHKKPFNVGLVLGVTFLGVLFLIFMPLFNGKTGLEFSDDLFNKLSKGSSYFIPELNKKVVKFDNSSFTVNVKLDKPEQVNQAVTIFSASGAQVSPNGTELRISGDLGNVLTSTLKDSDSMFFNRGGEVKDRYGIDQKEVMKIWWTVLTKSIKELQKDKKIEQANIISDVLKKGVEPAFNYYQIEPQSVADKAFTMIGLLVFYVIYTMWWGYAIFYMFEGIGLSMKKAKVKKEV